MTSDAKPMTDVWLRRALTVSLWLAYAPAFLFSWGAVKGALKAVRDQQELWGLALYAMGSCMGVSLALVTLTLLVRRVTARTQKRLFLFLLANWLPHLVLVWLWAFTETIGIAGAWID
jgi:hypothetical protein